MTINFYREAIFGSKNFVVDLQIILALVRKIMLGKMLVASVGLDQLEASLVQDQLEDSLDPEQVEASLGLNHLEASLAVDQLEPGLVVDLEITFILV